MPRRSQLSFLETGQGKGHLFGRGVLEKYLSQHRTTRIPDEQGKARIIREWLDSLDATPSSETSIESKFITDIFCRVLGYLSHPAPAGVTATIYPKPPARLTGIGRTPDAALGMFGESPPEFAGAVELKSPGTQLDVPQPGYHYETPVEQGFYYGGNILGMRWVVVSDMRVLRLYSVESSGEYEEIDLGNCVDEQGSPNEEFRRFVFLFASDFLVRGGAVSQVASLYGKSAERQIVIRRNFYGVYYRIRSDLYAAIQRASAALAPVPTRGQLLEATQRLLDRMLFIYYCEDHPQQLIKNRTVEEVVGAAKRLPGTSASRVYTYLKLLFLEIDAGSPPASAYQIPAYNGELFKEHPIVDRIDLPDSLSSKIYKAAGPDGEKTIHGVWGLHVYDFWSELNEHLLGHIFEESLSDLHDVGGAEEALLAEKMQARKDTGIFFTTSTLADFLGGSAFRATIDDLAPLKGNTNTEILSAIRGRIAALRGLHVADFACGSGAFLTSMYREILQEFYRLQSSAASIEAPDGTQPQPLFGALSVVAEARELPRCIYGVDILPQAVEIAKLAMWLRAARKDEKVLDLSHNIVAADSLDVRTMFARLDKKPDSFDIVVGNPPWGSIVDPDSYRAALDYFGLPEGSDWDSWEVFLLIAIRALRHGGRLALVLPDSFLYPQKARVRKLLFEQTDVEKVYNLGPDWFGKNVRMGTIVVQARRGPPNRSGFIRCMVLAGGMRASAIRGELPLTQIESQTSRLVPTERVLASDDRELEVFRGIDDDRIIALMLDNGRRLGGPDGICKRARGEEINKAGLIWICPSCLSPTTPGQKRKGGGFREKTCPECSNSLTPRSVETENLITGAKLHADCVGFIDGDDINRRYVRVRPHKWLRLGVSGWEYKPDEIYRAPKILIRQAGVGITATLDGTGARCPQSIYIYRLREAEQEQGYRHEFVLGALLSRTMAYFVFKRFAEVDPAKAHAKLTHERLESLPIPAVDFSDSAQKEAHDRVVANVRRLLDGKAALGEEEDLEVEQLLRGLWGISGPDGAYINGEFYYLPDGQAVRDLFPRHRPRPVRPGTVP